MVLLFLLLLSLAMGVSNETRLSIISG